VLGKVGMNHIVIDIKNENVNVNDTVYLDVSPILIDSKIRREYI
jgi:alanine racemase